MPCFCWTMETLTQFTGMGIYLYPFIPYRTVENVRINLFKQIHFGKHGARLLCKSV